MSFRSFSMFGQGCIKSTIGVASTCSVMRKKHSIWQHENIVAFIVFRKVSYIPKRHTKSINALSSQEREAHEVMECIWQHRNFCVEDYILNLYTSRQYIKNNLILHSGPKTEHWKKKLFLLVTTETWFIQE